MFKRKKDVTRTEELDRFDKLVTCLFRIELVLIVAMIIIRLADYLY